MQCINKLKPVKEYVKQEKDNIKTYLEDKQDKPVLLILQVGNNEASNRYVKNKIKDCEYVGIIPKLEKFDTTCTSSDIVKVIKDYMWAEEYLSGIMLQLPVPDHINVDWIMNYVPDELDVDGFKQTPWFKPCTPLGIIKYLEYNNFNFEGANAVVIGRSNIVGKPMAKMLLDKDCTVTICHSKTKDLKDKLKYADLVVCAAGKRGIISSQDAILATIIDVGINFNEDGKLCGDVIVNPVDIDRVTPVPGGVGLLTRLALLQNIMLSYKCICTETMPDKW